MDQNCVVIFNLLHYVGTQNHRKTNFNIYSELTCATVAKTTRFRILSLSTARKSQKRMN